MLLMGRAGSGQFVGVRAVVSRRGGRPRPPDDCGITAARAVGDARPYGKK